jgi:hypothetical protein
LRGLAERRQGLPIRVVTSALAGTAWQAALAPLRIGVAAAWRCGFAASNA